MKKHFLATLLVSIMTTACYNEGTLVINPAPLTNYLFQPTDAKLRDAAKAYAETINNHLEKKSLYPGLYADYGVALAKLGCLNQANVMFNNEKLFFPNSTPYIDYLIKTLTPQQATNKQFDTTRIDIKTLDTIKVLLTPEELAFQHQLDNDPEYQRLLRQQMKEEKEQKALEARKAKAEQSKAKELERKAKAKAKKKAQKEKAAAKKEAEKARKQAVKEAEKARKAEKKTKKEAEKSQ